MNTLLILPQLQVEPSECGRRSQPNTLRGFETQSVAPVRTWTHVAVVFNPDVGMSVYMDGILDAFKSIDEAVPSNGNIANDYVLGSKSHGGYPFEGTLDEIKVFYDLLSRAGREPREMCLQLLLYFNFKKCT